MSERSVIYGTDGTAKAECYVEYNGTWMGSCFLSADVKSPAPISFAIGDYVVYRNERFVLDYDPAVVKKARRGTYGEGFVYSGMKFYALSNELTQIRFRDIVLGDNHIHYTSLPQFSFYAETIDDLADRLQANTDRWCEENGMSRSDYWVFITPDKVRSLSRGVTEEQYNAAYGEDASFYTDGEKEDVVVDVSNISIWEGTSFIKEKFGLNFKMIGRTCVIGASGIPTAHLFKYGKGNGLYEIERVSDSEQAIVTKITAYGSEDNMPIRYYATIEEGLMPNNMAVNCLMSPGFPKYALSQLCRCQYDGITDKTTIELRKTPSDGYNAILELDGNRQIVFSTNKEDPFIVSPNAATLGIKEGTISFTEENDDNGLKKIYPSIEGMTRGDVDGTSSTERLDEILSCEVITDNGVFGEGDKEPGDFSITLKNLGFDLKQAYEKAGNGMVIAMKDGYCGGREFTVNAVRQGDNGTWVCTCSREHDELLDLYFPYSYNASIGKTPVADEPYQVRSGDHFVLTGIYLGDTNYIWAASVRLLRNSILWLLANDYTRYTYTPKVDEIFMAKQHDESLEYGTTSLHDTLKEGDVMLFEDADLGIDGSVYIDTLRIKENGNHGIPTYDVTLRNDKQVGTLQRMQNQINSLSSFVSGGGGGGYSAAQIRGFVQGYGSDYFLSKLSPDTAQALITFLQGIAVGNGTYGIDGNGDAILRNINAQEALFDTLTAANAHFFNLIIDEVKSVGGQLIITPANCTAVKVDRHYSVSDTLHRVYFRAEDDDRATVNQWAVGDQAIHYEFDVTAGTTRNYWRLVKAVSSTPISVELETGDTVPCHWIDLSDSDCKTGSDIPYAGDNIAQLGNRTDSDRQNAIIISAYNIPFIDTAPYLGQAEGIKAPLFASYNGINSYDIVSGNRVNVIAGNGNLFRGQVTIESGSTLADGRDVNGLGTEAGNLLQNTYFGGDYESEESAASVNMKADTPIWSDPMKHWSMSGSAVPVDDADTKSGRRVDLNGTLSQAVATESGAWYMLSFHASGTSLTVTIGGETRSVSLTLARLRYDIAVESDGTNGVTFTGSCALSDIILTKGTLPVEWRRSPLDPDKAKAEDIANDYLRTAISEASTEILGGLILSNIIKVGNYRLDEQTNTFRMSRETGGMSGAWNHDDSPFLWGGGDMEQAIHTIDKYKKDPSYEATDEEIAAMAKYVVTHGGRAILNDVILRGYIYAQGGLFKGGLEIGRNLDKFKVDADTGVVSITGPSSSKDEEDFPADPESPKIELFKISYETDPDTLQRITRLLLNSKLGNISMDAEWGIKHTNGDNSVIVNARQGQVGVDSDYNDSKFSSMLSDDELILSSDSWNEDFTEKTSCQLRISSDARIAYSENGTPQWGGRLTVDSNGFLKVKQ